MWCGAKGVGCPLGQGCLYRHKLKLFASSALLPEKCSMPLLQASLIVVATLSFGPRCMAASMPAEMRRSIFSGFFAQSRLHDLNLLL